MRRPEAPRRGGRPSYPKKNFSQPQAPPPPVFESAPFDSTPVDFATLNLDPRLARAITDLGFVQTTPVQSAVFPTVAAGEDLIACAQTGTGKTVAFLLPVLQRLLTGQANAPRRGTSVMILAPTRELAVQIEDDVRSLVKHTRISGVTVCGGMSMGGQARALRAGVDIVVATPGRLLDHMNHGVAKFDGLSVLILDEADRMVDMGFWPDVRRIVEALPVNRQTLLFSATTSRDVMKAAKDIMRDPKMMQVGKSGGLASSITHVSHHLPTDAKAGWLDTFLTKTPQHALVFVRTKHRADRLVQTLSRAATAARRSTPTAPRDSGTPRSRTSSPATSACWSPPTSPPAAWTWTASDTSSTSSRRLLWMLTSTESAGPDAPMPPAPR